MREFIRHPTRIPVDIRLEGTDGYDVHESRNLSLGGLAIQSDRAFVPGSLVVVRIPVVWPVFETRARVAWCVACKDDFELGIEFLTIADVFRARMVEQVCHIENYQMSVLRDEGRRLSINEAAREWIGRYASEFPEVGKPQMH